MAHLGAQKEFQNGKPREFERRNHLPLGLGFNPLKYSKKKYDEIILNVDFLKNSVSAVPPDKHGIRCIYLDSTPVIHYSYTFPIPFLRFTENLKINALPRTILRPQKWACRAMFFTKEGLSTCQATRVIFSSGGKNLNLKRGCSIDSCRLETVRHKNNSETVYWQMVSSPNNTVECDEGRISISKADRMSTRCEFLVKYKEAGSSLNALPGQKHGEIALKQDFHLTTDAWIQTISNVFGTKSLANTTPLPSCQIENPIMESLKTFQQMNQNLISLTSPFTKTSFALTTIGVRSMVSRRFRSHFQKELYDSAFEYVLRAMAVLIDKNNVVQQSIKNFTGVFQFSVQEPGRDITVIFRNAAAAVSKGKADNPDVSVSFKDTTSVLAFLLSPKPD
ncbi:MAG: hypothetical protein ACE5FU_07705, partial [Nitrospinota bacterium]